MHDQEDMIRARAYELWKAAGCPDGQDEAHWHQAASELGAGASGPSEGSLEDPTEDAQPIASGVSPGIVERPRRR